MIAPFAVELAALRGPGPLLFHSASFWHVSELSVLNVRNHLMKPSAEVFLGRNTWLSEETTPKTDISSVWCAENVPKRTCTPVSTYILRTPKNRHFRGRIHQNEYFSNLIRGLFCATERPVVGKIVFEKLVGFIFAHESGTVRTMWRNEQVCWECSGLSHIWYTRSLRDTWSSVISIKRDRFWSFRSGWIDIDPKKQGLNR